MKKLLLIFGLFLTTPLQAADHYFKNGSPDNTLPCTSADPCDNLFGTTLDNADAIACGDTVNFDCASEWTGQEAQVKFNSNGCAGNPIIYQKYGSCTTTVPKFYGSDVYGGSWTSLGGGIYSTTGQSQTYLLTVTQTVSNVTKALLAWNGPYTTMPEGSFYRSGSTLYVRLWSSANPATSNVRIGSYVSTIGNSDGSHGLVAGEKSGSKGNNVWVRDLEINTINGVGFSFSGSGNRSLALRITGSGRDGWLCWRRTSLGLGACADWGDYYSEVDYNVASANVFSGAGQGFTVYGGPTGFAVGTYSHHNGMAGIDLLDFASDTNVTEVFLLRTRTTMNGGAIYNPSYDPNTYSDGASEVGGWGNINGPRWNNYLSNSSYSLKFGSEHPTTKPTQNHWWGNFLVFGSKWTNIGFDEICYGSTTECPPDGSTAPKLTKNISLIYGTVLDYSSVSDGANLNLTDTNTAVDNITIKNMIYETKSGGFNSYWGHPNDSRLDADYNLSYSRGNASTSTKIYKISGGTTYNLAEWRTLTSDEAHSQYADPQLTTSSGTAPVATYADNSPAVDAGTTNIPAIPSWVPSTISSDITTTMTKWSTRVDGAADTGTPNLGYHWHDYANLTNVSCSPASSVAGTTTSYTCTFTMPDKVTAFVRNWRAEIIFPSDFTLNSGGTSVATSSTISGSWDACTVTGTTIKCARSGDGNSEFPGTYTVTISNVLNPPSAETTNTFDLSIHNPSGDPITGLTKISQGTAPGISISSAAGGGGGGSGDSITITGDFIISGDVIIS